MRISELASRSWYYFRIGYNTYLVFMIGYGSTLVTIYYLAIKNIPEIQSLFQRFWLFAVLSTVVGVPVSVLIGWVHTKRSILWKTEIDIATEANPYYYRLPPGYWKEAAFPAYLEILKLVKMLSERANVLTAEERARIEKIEKNLEILMQGGYVGTPRVKLDS
jgi:hypothetical protein